MTIMIDIIKSALIRTLIIVASSIFTSFLSMRLCAFVLVSWRHGGEISLTEKYNMIRLNETLELLKLTCPAEGC